MATTYNGDIDFDGGADPERVGIPGLVPGIDEGLPDVVGADDAGDGDDDAEGEEDADADALLLVRRMFPKRRERGLGCLPASGAFSISSPAGSGEAW